MEIISWLMGLLSFRNKGKKMDFTVLYDDNHQEFHQGSSKMEVLQKLELQGADYIEVIDGKLNIPPGAIRKFKNDPMSVLLSQIKKAPEVKPNAADLDPAVKAKMLEFPKGIPKPEEIKHMETPVVPNETPKVFIPLVIEEPKFFEEDGIQFKVESNGKVFKKVWETDQDHETRIVNIKNGKVYAGEQYEVQKLSWKSCF